MPAVDKERTRVLFVTAAFPPWKVAEADHALQECLHLAERGLEVHVVTTRRDRVAAPPQLVVYPVMERWGWKELGRLIRIVREVRPAAGMIFFLGWMYDYRAMATVTPTVVKIFSRGAHFVSQFSNLGEGGSMSGALRERVRRRIFRAAGRFRYGTLLVHSDRLIVMSYPHLDKMAEISSGLRQKTELVPPSPLIRVLPDAFAARQAGRKRLGVDQDTFLFTYFARLYPRKGIENLLRAFAEVAPEMPDARLAMVGGYYTPDAWYMAESYPQQIERLVNELALGERTVWTGEYEWDSDDPSEYLHASDVAVLPFDSGIYLHNSSFAAVASHGVPTIGCRGPVVEDALVDGKNLHLVPPRDADALAEALRVLYHDHRYRRRLALGARELAQEWFTWERATDRIIDMLGI